jgi:electron transport complex protein RnfD
MASRTIWHNASAENAGAIVFSGNAFVDGLFYKPSGAIGEYSLFFLIAGGLYLLARKRISWHIPFALCTAFSAGVLFFPGKSILFSPGGILLGAVYMATDMPTSASTRYGKLYYGTMIGLVAVAFIACNVRYEYMSYAILLLNAFASPTNWVFRPRAWGTDKEMPQRFLQGIALTIGISGACFAVIFLHHQRAMMYAIFALIIFCIARFIVEQIKMNRASIPKGISANSPENAVLLEDIDTDDQKNDAAKNIGTVSEQSKTRQTSH